MRFGWVVILAALLVGGPLVQPATANTATTGPAEGQLINRRDASGAASAAATSGPSAARVALSLGAVLALVVLLFLAARRFVPRGMLAPSAAGGAVQVLARTVIGPKQRIVLLQVGRRIIVVADDGQRLGTLSEITDADEAAALIAQLQSQRQDGSFSAALSSAMERFRAAQDAPADTSQPSQQPGLDAMRDEIDGLAQRVRGMAR